MCACLPKQSTFHKEKYIQTSVSRHSYFLVYSPFWILTGSGAVLQRVYVLFFQMESVFGQGRRCLQQKRTSPHSLCLNLDGEQTAVFTTAWLGNCLQSQLMPCFLHARQGLHSDLSAWPDVFIPQCSHSLPGRPRSPQPPGRPLFLLFGGRAA